MYIIYAIYNREYCKIYIGQTSDLNNRLISHNTRAFKQCYTSRFPGEWLLIYSEPATTRKEAINREKQLKSYRGREFLKKYIPE